MAKTRAETRTEARAERALDASLRRGETLPARWYTDPAVERAERARIFRRAWQFAGYADQVSEPGSYLSARVGQTPVVITRDQSGALHAFANVCRHRGSELVSEGVSGRGQTLQCAYHAWTYNLDGALRAAPGAKDEADFDPRDYPLFTLPLATWGPLLFVNPDREAAPLAETLGDLPRLAAEAGAPLERATRRASHTYDIGANWKVVVDNYLECYHCPVAHKGFTSLIDTNQYTVTEYDWFSVQTGALKAGAESAHTGGDGLYAVEGAVRAGFYAWLWPGFTFNVYPGHGNISINTITPLGVDRTRVVKDYLFVDGVTPDEEADFIGFIEQVQREDVTLCESVQRGLSTGYFDQGRLMLCQERALRHFQRLVYDTLAGAVEE